MCGEVDQRQLVMRAVLPLHSFYSQDNVAFTYGHQQRALRCGTTDARLGQEDAKGTLKRI